MADKFTKPYLFKRNNTVVIKHSQGKHLRTKPGSLEDVDPDGGKGQFAQWETTLNDDKSQVQFKNVKSGKYLRIKDDKVDVKGGGGPWTWFKVKELADKGEVKLESVKEDGKYIAIGQNNVVRTGGGGKWCKLEIFRE